VAKPKKKGVLAMKVLIAVSYATAKAVLCDGAFWNPKGYYDVNSTIKEQFWLPKSQIKTVESFDGKEFIGETTLHVIEVPGWLARNHGLKRYEWDGEVRRTPPIKFAEFPTEW
jgi:hypothetical protein